MKELDLKLIVRNQVHIMLINMIIIKMINKNLEIQNKIVNSLILIINLIKESLWFLKFLITIKMKLPQKYKVINKKNMV